MSGVSGRALVAVAALLLYGNSARAQDPASPVAEPAAASVTGPATVPAPAVQPAGPRLQSEFRSVPAPTFAETIAPATESAASSTTIRMSTLALVLVVVILVLLITD